jgi:DNA repair photolyase
MVSLTITTDNDQTAKLIEPNAPPPSKRIETAKALIGKDISTSVRIDPIIPLVNDNSESLIRTLAKIGVKHITASTYKAKPDNWQRLTKALSSQTIEELELLYFTEGERINRYVYLPKDLRFKLMQNMATLAKNHNVKFGTCREGLSQLNTATCDGSWLLSK